MTEPVTDPLYWKRRLEAAPKSNPHHAVFLCSDEKWTKIEAKHRTILERHLKPGNSVLDAGCGWGRLLDLMPSWWDGYYFGIDTSPDFITKAKPRARFHKVEFECMKIEELGELIAEDSFDWAVLVSIRGMLVRNCGKEGWRKVKKELLMVCRRILCLEYDPEDNGKVLERKVRR